MQKFLKFLRQNDKTVPQNIFISSQTASPERLNAILRPQNNNSKPIFILNSHLIQKNLSKNTETRSRFVIPSFPIQWRSKSQTNETQKTFIFISKTRK